MGPGFLSDATEHHFTQKERDSESGNDYFFARYYNAPTGRFLSPDWSAKVEPVPYAKMDDPQTLNLYAYVGNNPIIHVDVDGHCFQRMAGLCRLEDEIRAKTNVPAPPAPQQSQAQQQNNTEVAQNNPPPASGQNGQQPTTKQLTGDATEYNLPGAKLAYGGKFDGSKMAAAMTPDRAKNGQTVVVSYTSTDVNGHQVTTTIRVVVNDTGPFARGANGRALSPLSPDPNIVIDLTPTAMRSLTGNSHNRVAVTVTVPNE